MNDDKKIELIKQIFEMAYKNKKTDIFVEYAPNCEQLSVQIFRGKRKKNQYPSQDIFIYLDWDEEFGENTILKLENVINKLKGLK